MPNENNSNSATQNPSVSTPNEIKHLVLAGGGAKGALYPGALTALEHIDVLKNIQTVAGSSAGALTSAMLAVGLTPDEIDEQFKSKSFADFLKTTKLTEGGAFSVGSLRRHVNEVLYTHLAKKLNHLYEKHKNVIKSRADREFIWHLQTQLVTARRNQFAHPTFNDLARLTQIFDGLDEDNPHPFKQLVVTMTEYESGSKEGKTVYCKADKGEERNPFGDRPIAEVVACSACLPIVFAPVTMYGKVYRDGGIYDNTPIKGIDPEEREQTLALVFEDSSLAHEQAIFSKDEPVLAEPQFGDKVIETAFDASLPHCIFNDATTVRQHAAKVIRLMVPEGLDVATMKLTPELAAKATINGFMSVMTWAKAFYPSTTSTEEVAHPSVSIDDQTLTSDLSDALYAQLEQQKALLTEKATLLQELTTLNHKKASLERSRDFITKFNINATIISRSVKELGTTINGSQERINIIDRELEQIESETTRLSSQLLETKIYARHFLTSQILAWKESIELLDNPIFKPALLNFIDDIYQASKNIDDGKFFANHVTKISILIHRLSEPLNDNNKAKIFESIGELLLLFSDKATIEDAFHAHTNTLTRAIEHQSLLSELKAQVKQLPDKEQEADISDMLSDIEHQMRRIYQHQLDDRCANKLSDVLHTTQEWFCNILDASKLVQEEKENILSASQKTVSIEQKTATEDTTVSETRAPLVKTMYQKAETYADLTLSASSSEKTLTAIASVRTTTAVLRSKIEWLINSTSINNDEESKTDSRLLRTFDRISQAVTRFFTATVTAVKPSNIAGFWRRKSVAPEAPAAQETSRPAAAA